MKIVALSDLHIDKRDPKKDRYKSSTWGERSEAVLKEAVSIEADVFLFGGDLGSKDDHENSKDYYKKGLEIIAGSKAKHKLFYSGNNDLELLESSVLTEHYDELTNRFSEFGIHFLDTKPKIIEGIGFIGNVGWYDASLFEILPIHENDPSFPRHIQEARKFNEKWFREHYSEVIPYGLSSDDFFEHCFTRLSDQLDQLQSNDSVKSIVLGVHMVPDRAFVRYGHSKKFDYYNYGMGSLAFRQLYQKDKVVLGLTGHTHRDDTHLVGRQRVYNISSTERQRYHVFEIDDGVKVSWPNIFRGDMS